MQPLGMFGGVTEFDLAGVQDFAANGQARMAGLGGMMRFGGRGHAMFAAPLAAAAPEGMVLAKPKMAASRASRIASLAK